MNLVDWTSEYIDHLNSFKKDLIKKIIMGNIIECYHKERNVAYIIQTSFNPLIINTLKNDMIIFVLPNTKENLNTVIAQWQICAQHSNLKLMFVNPNENLHWSLIPYTHNRIADPHTLHMGLKSMFESVPEV